MAVPMAAAFVTTSNAQSDHLGLGMSGSGGSHKNRGSSARLMPPLNITLHEMGPQPKIVLAAPPIKAQEWKLHVVFCMLRESINPFLNHVRRWPNGHTNFQHSPT
jgi:hypothetical protein